MSESPTSIPIDTVAWRLARAIEASTPETHADSLRTAQRLLLDVSGICLAARRGN